MKKILTLLSIVLLILSYSIFKDINRKSSSNNKDNLDLEFPNVDIFSDENNNSLDLVKDIKNQKNKTFVHFWATWCAPCKEELPLLLKYFENANEKLILIAVSSDPQAVSSFLGNLKPLKKRRVIYSSSEDVEKYFGIYKLPETVVFSNNLRLVKRLIGPQSW